jgi:xylan 1,4-beta-xylosidase
MSQRIALTSIILFLILHSAKSQKYSDSPCKDNNGNVQVLLWDFTITCPDSLSNQVYFKRDLPSSQKGKVIINYKNLLAGKYEMKVYQTGYR